MTDPETRNLELVRRFIATVEAGTRGEVAADAFADLLHPDIQQHELPNRFAPAGVRRDLASLRKNADAGRRLMKEQRYEIVSAIAQGDVVALEGRWTGVLAISLGDFPAGHVLRAHLAMFFEILDGKIWRQRNYDCFEP